MSLGIVVKGPEGLVLAAESRVTLGAMLPDGRHLHVNFDNATKLLTFEKPNSYIGAVTYGQAAIGLRTAYSFLPEFESELATQHKDKRLSVSEFANFLSEFFMRQWIEGGMPKPEDYPPPNPNMTFVISGFDGDEPYGKVFSLDIPRNPVPVEQQPNPGEFGITWGGQREFVDRILKGYDPSLPKLIKEAFNFQPEQLEMLNQILNQLQMPLPLQALPLQDCVNLAIFFIRTTMNAQELTVGIRGVGGPIDVAIITRREGLKFIQRKQITGEVEKVERGRAK